MPIDDLESRATQPREVATPQLTVRQHRLQEQLMVDRYTRALALLQSHPVLALRMAKVVAPGVGSDVP